ncbi:hypothetical protein JIG36_24275 [Actinoplanes sp. LDG1-06]|uniref:GGDEF domain-containing protein n=1 Tax=Paractinoplanes ovalisporus TaxID=2810368 RepID=A0ABS2AHH4_9ACTN|nr:hypothetical protein [Actinoplanes ovalisporus]MBM2618679.1 hypothetical protein [Actinoplanes ovalisporus]
MRPSLAAPYTLSCGNVEGGGSVGVAVADPGQTPDEVIEAADKQMYLSKMRRRAMAGASILPR